MWLAAVCILFSVMEIQCWNDYYDQMYNVSRPTVPGIAAYRSALTLDWIKAEDFRQRNLVDSFFSESTPAARFISSNCVSYPRPASGKVARLLLELLKNLEGDDGVLVMELVKNLVQSHILVETSLLDAEPDLETLVKIPGDMLGEPHTTFPRILAMLWLILTDPLTIKQNGWCPIKKTSKYLSVNKPRSVAMHMKLLEPMIARIRFIMEEFIQHVTPLNMYPTRTTTRPSTSTIPITTVKTEPNLLVREKHSESVTAAIDAMRATDRLPIFYSESERLVSTESGCPLVQADNLVLASFMFAAL